jgi:hypothetical protein
MERSHLRQSDFEDGEENDNLALLQAELDRK